MKYLLVLVVVVLAAFVAGYVLEPSMRGVLIAPARTAKAKADPAPVPPPVATPDPTPAPEPDPEPAPESEPEPAPVAVPEPATAAEAEIRRIMETSIEEGATTRISADKITTWKGIGEEEIDGVTWQFGLITYREPTIFGEAEREAKALIRDGKVDHWIWTSNGMRIP